MASNAIKSDFRSSKMAAGGHFEKKSKKETFQFDLKWPVMRLKLILGHPKWPPAAILLKINKRLFIDLKWREM